MGVWVIAGACVCVCVRRVRVFAFPVADLIVIHGHVPPQVTDDKLALPVVEARCGDVSRGHVSVEPLERALNRVPYFHTAGEGMRGEE